MTPDEIMRIPPLSKGRGPERENRRAWRHVVFARVIVHLWETDALLP